MFFPILFCFACSNVPKCLGDDVPATIPERFVRHVNLSFSFSEESASCGGEDFDVCGLSAGVGFDLVPGGLAGLQLAGIVAAADCFQGVQFSLFTSLSKRGEGLQLSPVCNWTQKRFTGLQLAGIGNTASGGGVQAALGFNASDDTVSIGAAYLNSGRESKWSGLQLAGICNHACFLDGVQASLCYNYAVRCRGIQLATWNEVEELHGLQIGLINEAKSGAGLQIGLFNFFGDGDDRLLLPLVNARF